MSRIPCSTRAEAKTARVPWSHFAWSVLCISWFILGAPSFAAEYEQRQGDAVLRLEADKIDDGRVELRLSEAIHVTVAVEGAPALEVQWPNALLASSDWEVKRDSAAEKVPLGDGRSRWQASVRLSPLKPGELSLAFAPVRFRAGSEADRWEEAAWRPIPVRVSTEIYRADLSELRDVAPPEELPPAPTLVTPLTWVGFISVLLLVLLTGWTILRRRGPRSPSLSPDEWALGELNRIELPTDCSERGIDRFYTQLSDVLRRYLELRYHLPAPEQTTAEFLEATRRAPQLQPEHQAVLRQLLERCDLVKFARAQSSLEECRTSVDMARAFVEQTAECPSL